MDDSRLTNVSELAVFLESTKGFSLKLDGLAETYQFIDQTVDRFKYLSLKRKDKRVVLTYLRKVTLYKKAQLMRLVKRAARGELKRRVYVRRNGHRTYTPTDIKLLETTDVLHLRMSGLATREIMRREYEVFGDKRSPSGKWWCVSPRSARTTSNPCFTTSSLLSRSLFLTSTQTEELSLLITKLRAS